MAHNIQLNTVIPETCAGKRLDAALAELFPEYSRSRLKQWIVDGHVTLNQLPAKPRDKVSHGDEVEILATLTAQDNWQAQDIPLNILYEDNDILVLSKPAGLVVHPAAGNRDSTLLNALLHHCPSLEQLPRCGIIHRLDKDTTGIMVVCKTLIAHTKLVTDLQARNMSREYQCIVYGNIISGSTINEPIGRHPTKRTQMAIRPLGKPAVTHYRVLEKFNDFTYLNVKLETGRTHQIRVHMTHIHHPIVGDPTYGGRLKLPKNASDELVEALRGFKRQALHAWRLGLTHPVSSKFMQWECDLPEDMQNLLKVLHTL